jgi:histidinol-phosphate/aromatic aminotransferase/cobyric acid decarboxylase-like protein
MQWHKTFRHLEGVERCRIATPPNIELRLNRGERPQPLPFEIRTLIADALVRSSETIHQYPDYISFYQELREFAGVDDCPDIGLVAGAGIEEFIRSIMLLSCGVGYQAAAVLWPTCAMYEIYAKAWSINLRKIVPDIPTTESQLMGLLCDCLAERPDVSVLFLPNPGQPVDSHVGDASMSQLANVCATRNVLLVVDEAHFGFGSSTALPLVLKGHPNVIVMRTFSKYYAAAGARVGYAVGPNKLIKGLHAIRESGEIPALSMEIARVLMHADVGAVLKGHALKTVEGRDWLRDQINKNLYADIKAFGSYGFSLLLKFKSPAWKEVTGDKLAALGTYTKYNFEDPHLRDCMLLACGDRFLLEKFYDQLVKVHG